MSMVTTFVLTCPHCGYTQEARVWQSINVTVDPELKKKFCDSEINKLNCEQCNTRSFIDIPIMYHDMTLKFLLKYYPPESISEQDFFQQFHSNGTPAYPPELVEAFGEIDLYMRYPHIVFNFDEMVRYVKFRDGISHNNETAQ